MLNMLKNTDTFVYIGGSHTTVLNRLLSAKIPVISAKCDKNQLFIKTNSIYRLKIIALFDELCYNYKLLKSKGIKNALTSLSARIGLIIPIVVAIIFFSVLPCFILDIDVKCGENINIDEVFAKLDEIGIREGVFSYKTNNNQVEQTLQTVKGAAFVTVERVGSTLSITVFPELPQITIFDVTNAMEVVSVSDAVITRQIIYAGTPQKKKGDVVKRGELLIGGYILIADKPVPASANGEVFGIVKYTSSLVYNEHYVEYVRTGNKRAINQMVFFGKEFGKAEEPYALYEQVDESFKNKLLVPYTVMRTVYYELEKREVYQPFETSEFELRKKVLDLSLKQIPDRATILNQNVTVTKTSNSYILQAEVQVEQRINKR